MFARYVGRLRGVPCYIVKERWRHVFQARACRFGPRLVFRTEADFNDPAVQAHEMEHVRQSELVGPLYSLVYMAFNLIYGYDDNPFEVRAREAASHET